LNASVTPERGKRKARIAIALIIIVIAVGVSGFLIDRYFVDWKNTGNVAIALKVAAKTDTSVTFSWEEHGLAFKFRDLKMSLTEAQPDLARGLESDTWMVIWHTSNQSITSTTVDDLSPNTTYWFYMTVNEHLDWFATYDSNTIRTTTYPSFSQTIIGIVIILAVVLVTLILKKVYRFNWKVS
jgi:hypothetical protein